MKFFEILQEGSGPDSKYSITRTCLFITTVPVIAVWSYVSIMKVMVQDIPTGVYLLIAIFLGGKVGQSYVDGKNTPVAPTPPTPPTP